MSDLTPPTTVESVQEYLKHVDRLLPAGVLFRGQPFDEPLLPRLARVVVRNIEIGTLEQEIFSEFQRQHIGLLSDVVYREWELLALAQHHGLATRLLDWTENPLAGLWFAVCEAASRPERFSLDGTDGCVWMFDYQPGDYADPDKYRPFEVPKTLIYRPSHVAQRIRVQRGCFTIHKLNKKGTTKGFIAIDRHANYKNRLQRFRIRRRNFQLILRELNTCGVNAASLFPDIDGLCAFLNWNAISTKWERFSATI